MTLIFQLLMQKLICLFIYYYLFFVILIVYSAICYILAKTIVYWDY